MRGSASLKYLFSALLIGPVSLLAQSHRLVQPGPGDPRTIACSGITTNDSNLDALQAWGQGKKFASIEGDAVFGLANLGHTKESLEWYCRASAAGNAVASYEIGKIFHDGYVVNVLDSEGNYHSTDYLPDHATAYYWFDLAVKNQFTKANISLAMYLALGSELQGNKVAKDSKRALDLLTEAGRSGDTEALATLAGRYYGFQMAPWVMSLPVLPDKAKAIELAIQARKILNEFTADCSAKEVLNNVRDILPFDLNGRQILGGQAVAVHGSRSGQFQLECILQLGDSIPREDESYLDQLRRELHDGFTNYWSYSITQIPDADGAIISRQTKTEGFVQRAELTAFVIEAILSAAAEPTPPAPSEESHNIAPSRKTAQGPPKSSAPIPGASLTKLEQRANAIVLSMASGNFKAVTEDYTQGLANFVIARRGMPTASALGSTWQSFADRFGAFEKIVAVHEEQGRIPELVLVTGKFTTGEVNIEIVFGPEPARKTCNLRLQVAPKRTWLPGLPTNCM